MKKSSPIKENAKLQEFLNPVNDDYYGNLLLYVRSRSFLKDENVLKMGFTWLSLFYLFTLLLL